MKYKVYSDRIIKRILRKNGYYPKPKSGKGDHIKYVHKDDGDSIIFSVNMNPIVWRRMMREHNLKEE